MADLGKIVVTDGGTWNDYTTYEVLTLVRHNNAVYLSTQTTAGNEPVDDSEYWTFLIRDGVDGIDGTDGSSVTANVSKEDNISTLTVTDKDGTTTTEIVDGEDGVSPTATVTKEGKVATITITDANGETTVTITDGNEVEVDEELSEESENPVQNKTVTARFAAQGNPVLIQEDTPSDTTALWVW